MLCSIIGIHINNHFFMRLFPIKQGRGRILPSQKPIPTAAIFDLKTEGREHLSMLMVTLYYGIIILIYQ